MRSRPRGAFATSALAHDPAEFDRRMAAPTAIPTSCPELADTTNFSNDVTNPGVLELKTHCEKLRKKAAAQAALLDRSDIDLRHLHHRLERGLGSRRIRIGDRVNQDAWRDLPRQAHLSLHQPRALCLPDG